MRQRHAGRLRGRHAAFPAGDQHPRVECRADHAAALDHALELPVAELPVARHEGAAIAVAGPDCAAENIHRLVKRLVAQMRHVENNAEPLHLAQQVRPRRAKAAALVGAGRVGARAVMGRAKRAQAALVRAFEVLQRHHRVRSLEAQNIAHRQVVAWPVGPLGQVRLQLAKVGDLRHLTPALHLAVPGELALRLCPGLFRRMPAGQRVAALGIAGDLRCDAQADVATAHLRQGDGAAAAILLVGLAGFAPADLVERARHVAVPLERVHREIEVGV